jgi:hypothetical protein
VNIFPGRNQRGPDPYANVARGQQISVDSSRHGVVDDGCVAWEERILEARRSWPQANPADFERVGKRTYVDKATGVEYVAARGAVMLNIGGEQNRGINCFMVSGGRLIFLRRPEFEAPLLGATGHVHSQVVSAASPGPGGVRIL